MRYINVISSNKCNHRLKERHQVGFWSAFQRTQCYQVSFPSLNYLRDLWILIKDLLWIDSSIYSSRFPVLSTWCSIREAFLRCFRQYSVSEHRYNLFSFISIHNYLVPPHYIPYLSYPLLFCPSDLISLEFEIFVNYIFLVQSAIRFLYIIALSSFLCTCCSL
jgi:hypothetical protein